MNINIGEKIKDLRKFHGITQNALASYLGVSGQSVSKWETGVSMPDLSIIPDIASYFGISIDELFSFTPNRSREMQIELYFQALYHLMQMSTCTRLNGLLALDDYIRKNELNPLMREGVIMTIDAIHPDITTTYLKTKGKNEYTNFDENYIDCIITGIKNIQEGWSPRIILMMATAYIPKNISKAVNDKYSEACKTNFEENREKFYSKEIQSEKTNLLEFIAELPDEIIEKFLHQLHHNNILYKLLTAMYGASGEVNKRIIENIIPADKYEIIFNALTENWGFPLYVFWIYYFIYSGLHKQYYPEDYICKCQQEILDIYNQMADN